MIQKIPESLQRLIVQIEYLNISDSLDLEDLIRKSDISVEEMQKIADQEHDPQMSYGRQLLYKGKNFAIFLMTWNCNDFTAIHNHGRTEWGCVYFLGYVDHRLYEVSDKNIKLVKSSIVPAGTIVPVSGSLVHAMGNLSTRTSCSLHIYGSDKSLNVPNENSFVYEIEKGQIRETDGSASINVSEKVCRNTIPGLTTDPETLKDYLKIILPYYVKNNEQRMIEEIKAKIAH